MRCECGGKMKVTKTAYMLNWVRRRRQCLSCGVKVTSREAFDSARVVKGGQILHSEWPVVDNEGSRFGAAALHADARQALNAVVRGVVCGGRRSV